MADNAREHAGNQAGGQPPYHGVPANALPLTANEDRQWATLAHFGGILGCVPSLLIYLIFKDRGPFTAQESKEALNFTLPPTIASLYGQARSAPLPVRLPPRSASAAPPPRPAAPRPGSPRLRRTCRRIAAPASSSPVIHSRRQYTLWRTR
ncbi:MAG TPA: DUF4870 domain-containing protein [Arthrobacter sp.]|nr:DUF4870 domain-containing protein [Arthrobacter sp.]